MARPCGRWFTNGNLDTNDGDWIAEGIAQGQVTKNVEGVAVDRAFTTLSGGGEGTQL